MAVNDWSKPRMQAWKLSFVKKFYQLSIAIGGHFFRDGRLTILEKSKPILSAKFVKARARIPGATGAVAARSNRFRGNSIGAEPNCPLRHRQQ
jgi:hypothetical protein